MENAKTFEDAGSSLRQHSRDVRRATQQLAQSTRATLDDAALAWRLQAERNPYLSLGMVFGIGYVLGGGIPATAVRLGLSAGVRMAATMALREVLIRAAGARHAPSRSPRANGGDREGRRSPPRRS